MKKSILREVIKSEIKSLLLEGQMTTDEAFRVLRDIQNIYLSNQQKNLMGQALDALQAAEVSKMMDRERTNFKKTGERAGFDMRGINEANGFKSGKDFINEAEGSLKIKKQKDGKYYWTFTFKSGKVEEWPNGFNTSAEAQKDFMYRSRFFKSVNENLNPEVSRDVNRYIARTAKRYGYSEQDAVYAIMAALEQRKSDIKYDMPGFKGTRDALDTISIREEEDMSDDEMDKAAAKSARKGDSIATISNKLQKLVKQMKSKAKEFKAAEGDAKEKIKDELKKMTTEKKKLEKAL